MFDEADADGGGDLDQDEFVGAFRSILGENLSSNELTQLFMKIDANSDGNVDWEEFIDFMVFQEEGRDGMDNNSVRYNPTPRPDAPNTSLAQFHRESVECACIIPGRRLATSAHDGTLRLWHMDTVEHVKTAPTGNSWICCIECFPMPGGVTILALARVNRSIDFLDLGTYEIVGSISSLDSTPLRIVHRPANKTAPPALLVGCGDGTLLAIEELDLFVFSKSDVHGMRTLLERRMDLLRTHEREMVSLLATHHFCKVKVGKTPETHQAARTGSAPSGGEAKSRWKKALQVNTVARHFAGVPIDTSRPKSKIDPTIMTAAKKILGVSELKLHTDWVTQVVYAEDLDIVITASFDGSIKAVDPKVTGIKRVYSSTGRSIVSLAYTPRHRLFAACSSDWVVTVYNPYLTMPTITLNEARSLQISQILFADRTNQLIGLCSSTKDIVIWDTATHQLKQTIHDKTLRVPEDRLSQIIFDPTGPSLIATSNRPHVWQVDTTREIVQGAHNAPVAQVLFNAAFDVVVTADSSGSVFVWDYLDGHLVFRYSNAHGNSKLSCICLDGTCRRLLTGGADGSRHVWNFHNGQRINTLESAADGDVTDCIYVNTVTTPFFATSGWDRYISIYYDTDQMHDAKLIPAGKTLGPHPDDIMCIAFSEPNMLVAGVYGGLFSIWNTDSAFLRFTFDIRGERVRGCPSDPTPAGTDGYLSKVESAVGVVSVAFFKSMGNHLMTVTDDDHLRVWSISHDQAVHRGAILIADYAMPRNVTSVKVSDSDEVIVTGHTNGRIRTWSTFNLREHVESISDIYNTEPSLTPVTALRSFSAHRGAVIATDYLSSPAGFESPLILSGGQDNKARLWQIDGTLVGSFGGRLWKKEDTPREAQTVSFEKVEEEAESEVAIDEATAPTIKPRVVPSHVLRDLPRAQARVASAGKPAERLIYSMASVEPPRTPHLDRQGKKSIADMAMLL